MTKLELGGLIVITIIVLVGAISVFLFLDARRTFRVHEPPRQVPMTAAAQQVREQREADWEELHAYDWVDREENIVQVPIDQAMDLVVQRGADYLFRPVPVVEEPEPPAPPEPPEVAERFSVTIPQGELPEDADTITIILRHPDGDVVTTLQVPAAITRLELSGLEGEPVPVEEVEPVEEPVEEVEPVDEPVEEPEPVEEAEPVEPAPAPEDFDWQAIGEEGYNAQCASCHQAGGEGIPGAFPPLAGHAPELYEADRSLPIDILLYGLQGPITVDGQSYNGVMPAFGYLDDEQIAAILNHIMTAWDNEAMLPADFALYTPEDVAAERDRGLSPSDVLALRQEAGLD
jgi:mono/diheme cytochrome c family protein